MESVPPELLKFSVHGSFVPLKNYSTYGMPVATGFANSVTLKFQASHNNSGPVFVLIQQLLEYPTSLPLHKTRRTTHTLTQ